MSVAAISPLGATTIKGPAIDWAAISPLIALTAGLCIVLLVGLLRPPVVRRHVVPLLTLVALGAAAGLSVWQWGENTSVIAGALRIDDLGLALSAVCIAGGIAAVLLSWRGTAAVDAGHGEYHALLLSSILGMVLLAGATNLVTVFLGYELLSIPLYILCATHMRRERSLESGLKYLIIGSLGSAVLLYGLALIYGATAETEFAPIAAGIDRENLASDPLVLTGIGLCIVGLAFKTSIAPFHQWTPDVYEGAPTPITAFMAVATKAAAFAVFLRFFDVALIESSQDWAPALAVLATATIVIGNVGAIGQSSVKRMLAYSSVAQAGYMLVGVIVTTRLGIQATVFYLMVYLLMNLAAFAVIVARERETDLGDDMSALNGLGADRPWLAWPITIAMLGLGGFPATAGFFGKLFLIEAAVDNDYTWLGIVVVLGSAVSLAYYLRIIAAVWTRPAGADEAEPGGRAAVAAGPGGRPLMAGGAPEGDAPAAAGESAPAVAEGARRRPVQLEVVAVAVICAAATVFFGLFPSPLLDVARDAGAALGSLV